MGYKSNSQFFDVPKNTRGPYIIKVRATIALTTLQLLATPLKHNPQKARCNVTNHKVPHRLQYIICQLLINNDSTTITHVDHIK